MNSDHSYLYLGQCLMFIGTLLKPPRAVTLYIYTRIHIYSDRHIYKAASLDSSQAPVFLIVFSRKLHF